MALPRFLIIGAMKCGTTTLFNDLASHPAIYGPDDKEPHALVDDTVLTAEGGRAYERLFARAGDEQICFEASTHYTQRPKFGGVPERARQLLGPGLKVIYLVRDPIDRTVSHLHHALAGGVLDEPALDRALDLFPDLIDFSRYTMQITPWIETLGRENVRIYRFEDYVADRLAHARDAWTWLGLEPLGRLDEPDKVHNPSEGRPAVRGLWRSLGSSRAYRRLLRPLLPRSARERLRGALVPKSTVRPAPPTLAALQRVVTAVRDDVEGLGRIMGRSAPLWDLESTVRRRAAREEVS
ncbi:MAG: sulfotransferase domain-containing protein [Acidobacteriota bacterium]|nr:sulfotransferase domain-containing protein [Acidobacteriota bacterium]